MSGDAELLKLAAGFCAEAELPSGQEVALESCVLAQSHGSVGSFSHCVQFNKGETCSYRRNEKAFP